MTDDELDLLASAYVDGEATPDEVAMVERDPELQARVLAFRAVTVDGSLSPPPGLADRHLAAAMAEFETIAGSGAGTAPISPAASGSDEAATAPVVDLRAGSARRSSRRFDRPASAGAKAARRPARTMPSWLPAAAGFVIVAGGLVWALGQTGGSDDDADTAEVAASVESAEDEGGIETADESAEAQMATAMAEEEMEESAGSDDALDGTADDSSRAESGAAGSAAAAPEADADASAADDAEADLAVPEPQLFFDEVPDPDTIGELPEPETDLELSLCGPEVVTDALGEPLGFVTVEIDDELAELYLFLDGDGTEIRLLVGDDCQPLEP